MSPTIRTARSRFAHFLLPGLVAAVIGAALVASAGDDAAAKVLSKLDDEWSAAASTLDAERVASYYAIDANVYPPDAKLAVGRAAAKKAWGEMFATPGFTIAWKTTHAEVVGDLGYTAGTYEDSFKDKDGKTVRETGKYLCVWKKQKDGTWKAIHDMWNGDGK